jgi:hypothetical protein
MYLYFFIAGASIFTWKYLNCPIYDTGYPVTTRYKKIIKLYVNIKNINRSKYPSNRFVFLNECKLILISATTTITTIITTIIKVKEQQLKDYIYSPKKLINYNTKFSSNLLVLPYYHKGEWFNAIINHSPHISFSVISVSHNNINVTDKIKSYLGPSEDFYGQNITPGILGYDNLIFTYFCQHSVSIKSFDIDDLIDTSELWFKKVKELKYVCEYKNLQESEIDKLLYSNIQTMSDDPSTEEAFSFLLTSSNNYIE